MSYFCAHTPNDTICDACSSVSGVAAAGPVVPWYLSTLIATYCEHGTSIVNGATCPRCPPETTITDDPGSDGSMDDLIISGGITSVHVERLDKDLWWAAVNLADGSRVIIRWRSRKPIRASWDRELK